MDIKTKAYDEKGKIINMTIIKSIQCSICGSIFKQTGVSNVCQECKNNNY